jgi:hypothetical protein
MQAVPAGPRVRGANSTILSPPDRDQKKMVERLILAIRQDFGCLVIMVAFFVVMVATIIFADVITPPSSNPFV